jgi:hypothetical protein
MSRLTHLIAGAVFSASLLFIGSAASAEEQGAAGVPGGTIVAQYSKREVAHVADKPGHVLLFMESAGTNVSSGTPAILAGYDVTLIAYADIVEGNGSYEGYITFMKGGSRATAKLDGAVTTVLSDGEHATAISGTFRDFSWPHAGKTGTFEMRLTSDTRWLSNWRADPPSGNESVSR